MGDFIKEASKQVSIKAFLKKFLEHLPKYLFCMKIE
jgi:hypothetical protein